MGAMGTIGSRAGRVKAESVPGKEKKGTGGQNWQKKI